MSSARLSLMGPQGLEEGQLNNYVMVQPIIHVSDDNRTAKARWRSDVQLARAGKGRWGGGVYENEYVNDNGTWKFSKLHYYVTFWGDYEQGWAAKPFPMDPPSTAIPPDQPPTRGLPVLPEAADRAVPLHQPCHRQADTEGVAPCATITTSAGCLRAAVAAVLGRSARIRARAAPQSAATCSPSRRT